MKIILSILLLICLANMPYSYFQFVRFVALVGFLFLAYSAYQEKRQSEMIIYLVLALLFQPFLKIAFGRQLWNIIDVIVGLGLILSIFIKPSIKRSIKSKDE